MQPCRKLTRMPTRKRNLPREALACPHEGSRRRRQRTPTLAPCGSISRDLLQVAGPNRTESCCEDGPTARGRRAAPQGQHPSAFGSELEKSEENTNQPSALDHGDASSFGQQGRRAQNSEVNQVTHEGVDQQGAQGRARLEADNTKRALRYNYQQHDGKSFLHPARKMAEPSAYKPVSNYSGVPEK